MIKPLGANNPILFRIKVVSNSLGRRVAQGGCIRGWTSLCPTQQLFQWPITILISYLNLAPLRWALSVTQSLKLFQVL